MDPEQKSTRANKNKETKKKILIFFIILVAAIVILPIINMIDFDAILQKDEDEKEPEVTTVTLGRHHFTEPDYEEDIMQDERYLEKNRRLYYTYENETFEINGDAASHGSICVFLDEYFSAVISGDCDKYNSMFTDEYIEKYGEKSFTRQKLYNINAECLRSEYLANGDANGKYKGYYVYFFEVTYNILDNNGTFRNDFLGDEGVSPVIFEIIDGNNEIKISGISVYSSGSEAPTPTNPGAIFAIIFAVLLLLFLLFEVITRRCVSICFALGCVVGAILSIIRRPIGTAIVSSLLVALCLLLLRFTVLKKFIKKYTHSAKKQSNSVNINRT